MVLNVTKCFTYKVVVKTGGFSFHANVLVMKFFSTEEFFCTNYNTHM